MKNTNVLYTNNCPKCIQLKRHMERNNINFTVSDNLDEIQKLGFASIPVLKTYEGQLLNFATAWRWVQQNKAGGNN